MHYKLSNTAPLNIVEEVTGLSFVYPHIYKPQHIINGQTERILPIITQSNPNQIQFGIWGLLPQNYDGDWYNFQGIKSTLATSKSGMESSKILYEDALNKRRCIILTTGFYTYYLEDNKVVEHLIEAKNNKLLYLVGIYNILSDGFISFSLLETKASDKINTIQNLNNNMPIQVPKENINTWLDNENNFNDLEKLADQSKTLDYKIH